MTAGYAAAEVRMNGVSGVAWAVVSGGFAIASAVRLRHDHGRWWMGFTGALSVVAGTDISRLLVYPLVSAPKWRPSASAIRVLPGLPAQRFVRKLAA
jgi:hypothetical protein